MVRAANRLTIKIHNFGSSRVPKLPVLVLQDGGDALLGLLHLALERGLEVPQLGQLQAAVGLLDVELSDAALVEASELDWLGDLLALSDL